MKLKKKTIFRFVVVLIITIIFAVGFVYGKDIVLRYRFDDIEKVPINSNRNGDYIARPIDIIQEDWLTNFAGGNDESFVVRVGQVLYNNKDNTESYIELESKQGKVTLIANGAHYEYYEGTKNVKRKIINFLTGKILEGKEVIKDYTGGKVELVLVIEYDEKNIGTPIVLYCSDDGLIKQPKNNYYNLQVSD